MVHPLVVADLRKNKSIDVSLRHQLSKEKTPADSTYRFPAHDVTEVDDHVHVWGPGLKLPLPGGERW